MPISETSMIMTLMSSNRRHWILITHPEHTQGKARRKDRPVGVLREKRWKTGHETAEKKGNSDDVTATPALGHDPTQQRRHQVAPEERAENVGLFLLVPRVARAILRNEFSF